MERQMEKQIERKGTNRGLVGGGGGRSERLDCLTVEERRGNKSNRGIVGEVGGRSERWDSLMVEEKIHHCCTNKYRRVNTETQIRSLIH